MIQSFRSKATEDLFYERKHKRWANVRVAALQSLDQLAAAVSLNDLRVPPSNRMEALQGDRKGEYSIRINNQWRICFRWTHAGPYEVEIVDYH